MSAASHWEHEQSATHEVMTESFRMTRRRSAKFELSTRKLILGRMRASEVRGCSAPPRGPVSDLEDNCNQCVRFEGNERRKEKTECAR